MTTYGTVKDKGISYAKFWFDWGVCTSRTLYYKEQSIYMRAIIATTDFMLVFNSFKKLNKYINIENLYENTFNCRLFT